MHQYFEQNDDYLILGLSGSEISVIYGKIGGPGLYSLTSYRSRGEAELAFTILVESKKKAGYALSEKSVDLKSLEIYNLDDVYLAGSRYFESESAGRYWEIIDDNANLVIHEGMLGTRGERRTETKSLSRDAKFDMELLIATKQQEGYKEKAEKHPLAANPGTGRKQDELAQSPEKKPDDQQGKGIHAVPEKKDDEILTGSAKDKIPLTREEIAKLLYLEGGRYFENEKKNLFFEIQLLEYTPGEFTLYLQEGTIARLGTRSVKALGKDAGKLMDQYIEQKLKAGFVAKTEKPEVLEFKVVQTASLEELYTVFGKSDPHTLLVLNGKRVFVHDIARNRDTIYANPLFSATPLENAETHSLDLQTIIDHCVEHDISGAATFGRFAGALADKDAKRLWNLLFRNYTHAALNRYPNLERYMNLLAVFFSAVGSRLGKELLWLLDFAIEDIRPIYSGITTQYDLQIWSGKKKMLTAMRAALLGRFAGFEGADPAANRPLRLRIDQPIVEFDPGTGIRDPERNAYRISVNKQDEEADPDAPMIMKLEKFLRDPDSSRVRSLIIGPCLSDESNCVMATEEVDKLVESSPKLPNLEALHFGDTREPYGDLNFVHEYNDFTKLVSSFPKLEFFWITGTTDIFFPNGLVHDKLETLIIDTNARDASDKIVRGLVRLRLPSLRYLALWFDRTRDANTEIEINDLSPLLENDIFRQLECFSLTGCINIEKILPHIVKSALMDKLVILDLRYNQLGDKEAGILLEGKKGARLKRLDLSYNSISPELTRKIVDSYMGVEVALNP